MRLELGVDTRLVDLDHEVAVVVVRQRRQHGVEIDDSEARLAPQPLGRADPVVLSSLPTLDVKMRESVFC